MKKIKSIAIIAYLPISFFIMLFLVSMTFNVLGYWIHGGDEIFIIIKRNVLTYLKIGTVGLFVGFALWFFRVR
jgi:hypothetical protein